MELAIGKLTIYRSVYIIVVLIMMTCAWAFSDQFLIEPNSLDSFSYIASVITIIALVISIGEILHGSYFSKTVYQLTKEKVDEFKKDTRLELKLECLNCYTVIIESIDDELYSNAYLVFKHAKKIDDYLYSHYADKDSEGYKQHPSMLLIIEKKIFALRRAIKGKGLNPRQQKELVKDVFKVKESLACIIHNH